MNKKKFLGLCEDTFWMPFISSLIDAHNMAWKMTGGDDINYCKMMALHHNILVTLYVDSGAVDLRTFNRTYQVFIYVLEFVYGDPYCTGKKTNVFSVTTEEYFKKMKQHWNDDINEKLLIAKKKQAMNK